MSIILRTFSEKAPDNIDELETMDFVDYEKGPYNGIVIMDGIVATQALRANAKESWVDVYVALGIDKSGMFIPARVTNSDGRGVAIYRVYGPITILKLSLSGEQYIKKVVGK